jgi:hypothetical protein
VKADPCSFEGCGKAARVRGLCHGHEQQERRGIPLRPLRSYGEDVICSFEGCGRPAPSNGLCDGHRQQKRRGRPLKPLRPYVRKEVNA